MVVVFAVCIGGTECVANRVFVRRQRRRESLSCPVLLVHQEHVACSLHYLDVGVCVRERESMQVFDSVLVCWVLTLRERENHVLQCAAA